MPKRKSAPSAKARRAAAKPFQQVYSSALGDEIWARVAMGESLASICREARMPCAKTVYNWMETRPRFAEHLRRAQATARLAVRAAHVERRRQRLARPKRRECPGGVSGYSFEITERFCDLLVEGLSLAQICQRPDMPSPGTIYNWLRNYPEFAEAYGLARFTQAEALADAAYDRALRMGSVRAAEQRAALRELRTKASHLQARVWGLERGWGTFKIRRET